MRSPSTRLAIVPNEPGAGMGTDVASEPWLRGTDLLMPPELVKPLAEALESKGYKLEQANTAKNRSDNISFHRIVGRSESGNSAVALLYFDESRIDILENDEWLAYALCIRICKHFAPGEHDRLGIAFLAPEGTTWPEAWPVQCDDIADLGIVGSVRFRRVAHPAAWVNAEVETAMQNVRDWVGKLDLRPMTTSVTDTFGGRADSGLNLSPVGSAPTELPEVFVSYSHADSDFFQMILKHISPLGERHCRIWTDQDLKPSKKWDPSIRTALERSQIVILLVSETFLASEYVANVELKHALDAADEGKKKLLWVYVRPVMTLEQRISAWTAAHDINEPLAWLHKEEERLEQLDQIYRSLSNCLKELNSTRQGAS